MFPYMKKKLQILQTMFVHACEENCIKTSTYFSKQLVIFKKVITYYIYFRIMKEAYMYFIIVVCR